MPTLRARGTTFALIISVASVAFAQQPPQNVTVTRVGSSYRAVAGSPAGSLRTGQPADIQLSGPGFNRSGGAQLFNHPGLVASDGTHLVLADRNNNRVLVWNTLPDANTPPDLVLGQDTFETNDPGTTNSRMNWPVSVSVGGGKLLVTDTYNNRILVWTTFPTRSGQPADLVLETSDPSLPRERKISWPWGVWTDGSRLAVSSTQGQSVLIWNTFPSRGDAAPDLVLTANGLMGTPRMITSNGTYLIVGDHNAKTSSTGEAATFVWKSWPARSDQPHDFVLSQWRQGTFADDGMLFLLSMTNRSISVWNQPPVDAADLPDLVIGTTEGSQTTNGAYNFFTGDGSGICIAGGRFYVSLSNGNKIVGYNAIPASATAIPDFAVGAPDVNADTLLSNFIISNPVLATDGTSLFASSDFDRRLYVWSRLPDDSNSFPDYYYTLPEAPWDVALWKDTLVLAGKRTVYLWSSLPRAGEMPTTIFNGKIGNVTFNEILGVALDDRYFYLSDSARLYVWDGIPDASEDPIATLTLDSSGRLDSDGTHLAVIQQMSHRIRLYEVNGLTSPSSPSVVGGQGTFNLPGGVLLAQGRLYVGDTGFNRVLVWNDIDSAIAGATPDVILGAASLDDHDPAIGQATLFWPASVAFDGSRLWVGEFKFSERIVRFSRSSAPSRPRAIRR